MLQHHRAARRWRADRGGNWQCGAEGAKPEFGYKLPADLIHQPFIVVAVVDGDELLTQHFFLGNRDTLHDMSQMKTNVRGVRSS